MGKRKRSVVQEAAPKKTVAQKAKEGHEERMVDFVTQSMLKEYPFGQGTQVPQDVKSAIEWIASRTAEEVCAVGCSMSVKSGSLLCR